MIVGFTRYSRDKSFQILSTELRFVAIMAERLSAWRSPRRSASEHRFLRGVDARSRGDSRGISSKNLATWVSNFVKKRVHLSAVHAQGSALGEPSYKPRVPHPGSLEKFPDPR